MPRSIRDLFGLLLIALALAACGSAEEDPGEPGDGQVVVDPERVEVADIRFDGDFVITEVSLDGQPVSLATVPSLNVETEFGTLLVRPACSTYFGSFSLTEGGMASFTIPGGEDQDCGPAGEAQEAAVLEALRDVTTWSESGDGFRFDGPSATFTIAR